MSKDALKVVARSISTSYRDIMSTEMLTNILRTGEVPPQFHPHMMALLEETPLPLVLRAVEEAASVDVPATTIMSHLHRWSELWKTRRTGF